MRRHALVFLLSSALLLVASRAEAQYLVPGVGMEGVIVIGEYKDKALLDDWNPAGPGLDYRIDNSRRVVLIRCQEARYATDRNIRIGSPENALFRWYGAAREKEVVPDGAVYGYLGISFAVKSGQVVAIYIFPRYLLKK